MLTKRIIPCLDCDLQVPEGRVVKGVEFKEIKYAGNPVDLATRYYEEGADEVVVLDITASHERRATMADVIDRLTENVFMPICVGGGIRKVDDYIKMLKAGADKCSTNTAAIKNPELLTEASKVVGSQAVVIGIDAKRRYVNHPDDAKDKTVIKPIRDTAGLTQASTADENSQESMQSNGQLNARSAEPERYC